MQISNNWPENALEPKPEPSGPETPRPDPNPAPPIPETPRPEPAPTPAPPETPRPGQNN